MKGEGAKDISRSDLAEKLDKDIDDFMDQLAARRKAQGGDSASSKPFDFDQWCKEIDAMPGMIIFWRSWSASTVFL